MWIVRQQQQMKRHHRAGLAPLELVLSLPLLLCVLAVIINFGNAGTWKVRAATAERLVVWRARPGFGVPNDPDPQNLPPSQTSLSIQRANRVVAVDQYWNIPDIQQNFLRGTAATTPYGPGIIRMFDFQNIEMSEGMFQGEVDMRQRFPFLPSAGEMHYNLIQPMVDQNWQFSDRGYPYNHSRRSAPWYRWSDAPEWAQQRQRFQTADNAIRTNPDRELLRPLDRDDDLIDGGYPFDFYPRMPGFCSDNPQEVNDLYIQNDGGLVDRIQGRGPPVDTEGVVERMARTFRRMYADELAVLLASMNPPAGRVAELQQYIQQLDHLLAQIP